MGVRLKSPTWEVLEQSFHLGFLASNNEAEYEALIAGLRLANQFSGEYEAKKERLDAYLKVVQELSKEFDFF